MNAIQIIKQYWGHTGLRPAMVVDTNQFGNLIVQDNSSRFWRITPEELECKIIAKGVKEFAVLKDTEEFKQDWEMTGLVLLAMSQLGELADEQCYTLEKAGDYSAFKIVTIADLIIDSGIAAKEKAANII